MKLVRTEYIIEDNLPTVYLFCREDGKRKIIKDRTLRPYFYVPYEEKDKLSGVEVDKEIFQSVYGEKLARIYTTMPSDVATFRDMYSRSYESDVLFPLRWLIDKVDVLEPCSPRIMMVDIETDNSGRVPNATTAPEAIIAITAYCNTSYTTFVHRTDLSEGVKSSMFKDCLHEVHYFRDEVQMLDAFIDYCKDEEPDIMSGWNCIMFDMPYIVNRMKRLGLRYDKLSPMKSVYIDDRTGDVKIRGVAIIDLMNLYKQTSQTQEPSYSLDAIGKKELGEGKIGSGGNVKWMWTYKLEDLINYNCNDVYICVALDAKKQLLDFLDEMRRLCYCQFEDCTTITRMADTFILRMFHGRKVFPSKRHDNKDVGFEGAIVETKAGGLYENVAVYDVKSLYPSIVVTANLSPESMRDKAEPGTLQLGRFHVRQDVAGYLPEVINFLFKERTKYKVLRAKEEYGTNNYKIYNMRQESVKRLLNALYGQTAYPKSRFYDPRVAETITWMGRQTITWSRDYAESIGYKVIYMDTDSLHTLFDSPDIEQINIVLSLINKSYDEFVKQFGFKEHCLEIQFEKLYRKVFYNKDTKKRYAGALCWKDGKPIDILDIWGFETRRSDSSELTRRLLTTVFDMVLRQDKSKVDVMRYIGEEINVLRSGRFHLNDIGIPKGISKEPEEYHKGEFDTTKPAWEQKGLPANIRGTLYTTISLGYELSSKPKLVYVSKMPEGFAPIDVICFDDESQIPAGIEIDVEKMLDRTIRSKISPIFSGLGWRMDELVPWWRGKPVKEGIQERLFSIDYC